MVDRTHGKYDIGPSGLYSVDSVEAIQVKIEWNFRDVTEVGSSVERTATLTRSGQTFALAVVSTDRPVARQINFITYEQRCVLEILSRGDFQIYE